LTLVICILGARTNLANDYGEVQHSTRAVCMYTRFSIKLIQHLFLPERVAGSDLLLFMAGGGERLTRSATSLHHLYVVLNHLARAPSQQSFLPSYGRHVRGSRLSRHR
jgi:hypothetical protein